MVFLIPSEMTTTSEPCKNDTSRFALLQSKNTLEAADAGEIIFGKSRLFQNFPLIYLMQVGT